MDTKAQIEHNLKEPEHRQSAPEIYEFDAYWRGIPVICRVAVQGGAAQELLALMVDGRSLQHGRYEMFDISALLKRDEESTLLAQFDPANASYVI